MANHAGFAAVAQVRDTVLNESLRILHHANLIPHAISVQQTVPNPVGSGSVTVSAPLFLDAPRVGLSSNPANRIVCHFAAAGPVTATGAVAFTRHLRLAMTLLAAPTLTVVGRGVQIAIDPDSISVSSIGVSATDGGAVANQVTQVLNSAGVRMAVTLALRAAAAQIDELTLPLFDPALEAFGIGTRVVISDLRHRVLNGVLAVGIDVAPGLTSVTTSGSTSNIPSFLSQSDIATCVNPALLPAFRDAVRPRINAAAAAHGVTIDQVSITAGPDHLRITGHATKGDFGASFSMRVKPKLGTPDVIETWDDEYGQQYTIVAPGTDDVWIDAYDVVVDEELPWWAWLGIVAGSMVLAPVAPVIIAAVVSIIDSVRSNIVRQFEGGTEEQATLGRRQVLTLPGTTFPFIELSISQLVFGSAGIQARLLFSPRVAPAGTISGLSSVDVEEWFGRAVPFQVSVAPLLWHPVDPTIRIRWQLRRQDTGTVLQTQEMPATASGARRFRLWVHEIDPAVTQLTLSCRVYRVMGTGVVTDLTSNSRTVKLTDRLDRTRRYVNWRHEVHFQEAIPQPNGSLVKGKWRHEMRRSAIHRTSLPGRCRFASHHPYPSKDASGLLYADELPFPAGELLQQRDLVCDYCFFGGPDKSVPLDGV